MSNQTSERFEPYQIFRTGWVQNQNILLVTHQQTFIHQGKEKSYILES